ncbi:hypothetical protein [Sinomicrobium oceani]|uniref:hypothetical protein n=1 Tax=Sinomicrobium oceani TaxID=1150368 RepID=UPI00227BF4B6|nr:hypothetical protein [Sinomicrobium oceani]
MTINELRYKLERLTLDKDLYSFDEKNEKSKYYLLKNNDSWRFYLVEKGFRKLMLSFEREDDACNFFYIFLTEILVESENWRFEKKLIENSDESVEGVKIWEFEWESTGKYILIKDPLYSQVYLFEIYRIYDNNKILMFAIGEFSNGIWGVYLKKGSR